MLLSRYSEPVFALLAIWYAAGFYALALTVAEVVRRVRSGQPRGRVLVTCLVPVLVGFTLFASWPMVALAMARAP